MVSVNERIEAIVKGRVHGVGYRFYAVSKAEALGLKGFARNLSDGSVEVVAEGPKEKLEALISALHDGPGTAMVENVKVVRGKASGEFKGFHVRH